MQPVTTNGIVTKFKGNGRKLGYPTANLAVETGLKDGVYFGFADLAGYRNHPALIFVGTPTTMGDPIRRVEAHLLDIPDEDYYDESLSLNVSHFHRPNKTFADVATLQAIIKDDERVARGWFSSGSSRT